MTLHITVSYYNKRADLTWGYHVIHWLRRYAYEMIGVDTSNYFEEKETPAKVIEQFPNLCYHWDGEGYYVGKLPSDYNESWPIEAQIAVGSAQGLYKELQRISAHMIEHNYDGNAKEVLSQYLKLFTEVEYDPENPEACFIRYS